MKILAVEQWGDVNLGNNGGYFYGCSNLTSDATDSPDLNGTTDLSNAFRLASAFNGDISSWEVSEVTSIAGMFLGGSSFNQDIGGWDTGNVVNMRSVFTGALVFNQDLGAWDTSKVTAMSDMFFSARAFNQDLDSWDTGEVTTMFQMFARASAFNGNISTWDTSKVSTMSGMFLQATSFNQDLSAWNVGAVPDMGGMFDQSSLSNANYSRILVGWSNLPSLQTGVRLDSDSRYLCAAESARQKLVTTHRWRISDRGPVAGGCFESTWFTGSPGVSGDTGVQLPLESDGTYNFVVDWGDGSSSLIKAWDAPAARHMYPQTDTFTIKISGTLTGWRFNGGGDVQKVRNIARWGDLNFGNNGGYFKNAVSLTSTASDNPDLTDTTNLADTFYGAQSFNGDLSSWDTSEVTDMSGMFNGAFPFNQDVSGWDTSSVTNMASLFASTNEFDQDISTWNTSAVEDMSSMFFNALKFDADISGWNVGKVTSMSYMFAGAAMFNHDIGGWDTSAVKNMSAMLSGANSFNQDIGSWDTSAVQDMSAMFNFTPLFDQDISGWDTSQVTNMSTMFLRADSFNREIGQWDTSRVTSMQQMFAFSPFNRDISDWDTSSVENMQGMFWTASGFNQDLAMWDIASVTNMSSMFDGSGLSSANYDSLLIGWAAQAVQANVPLGVPGIQYSCAAADARQSLIDDHTWSITDAGLGPCVSISPDPVTFDPTTVNHTGTKTVTVSNPGGADLLLPADAVTVTGADATQFNMTTDTCTGATVAAAGSCTVTVTFTPTSTGNKTAGLLVTSNAVTSPDSVSLIGSGVLPGFSASPDPVDFGSVSIGKTGGPQTVTVTNGGPGKLTVSAATISGDGFAITGDTCTTTSVPNGGTCTVQVSFSPTTPGVASGQLSFTSNAPGSPHTVELAGTGAKAAKKKQTLKTKLPKRIKLSGLTVITPANARTNAGQLVRTIVRGGPTKPTAAGEVRYYTVVRGSNGKTSVRTYGYPNLRIKVTQEAPATSRYTAFTRTATYTGGTRN